MSKIALDDLALADGELFHDHKGAACPMPAPLVPLADTHGHLTSFRELDPAVALVRAALAGVRLLVVPIDPIDDVPRRWESVPALLSWLDEQVERARAGLAACAEHGFVPPAFEGYDAPDLLDSVRIVAGAHPYGAEKFDDDVMARLRELLASGQDLRAEVLVAPHHGSAGSFLPAFYAAVRPREVLVSCGFMNRFRYPSRQLRQWLARHDIPLRRTDEDGQLTVSWPVR